MSPSMAELSWTAVPHAETYHIYRGALKEATDLGCLKNEVVETSTSDDGLLPEADAVFFYVVTAVNSSGESPAGEERIVATPCP